MTNGENILSAFSNATIRRCKNKDFTYIEVEQNDKWIADFDMEWWNAEYKEPNMSGKPTSSQEPILDKIRAEIKALSPEPTAYDVVDGNPVKDAIWETLIEVDKIIDKYKAKSEDNPRKGEWLRMSDLSEQEDDRYKCSRCGNVIHQKNKMDLYTFHSWCGRCGSDNGI